MPRIPRALASLALLSLAFAGCNLSAEGPMWERQLDRTFTVAPGSTLRIEISGGSVTTEQGPPGTVQVQLHQTIDATTERQAQEIVADYDLSAVQTSNEVLVLGRRKRDIVTRLWSQGGVRISATLTVPPDVKLDVQTSGGSIRVRGDRAAALKAQTSGGSIKVDAGPTLLLGTSGGSITVGEAPGSLRASTSGGAITVDHVGAKAQDVNLNTSGGSIHVGVDPSAALAVDADTSGGTVRVDSLAYNASSQSRSHTTGTLNGGGGRLQAHTSGGSVTIHESR